MLARERGMRGVLVPACSAAEALVVEGIEIYAIERIHELIAALDGVPDNGDFPAEYMKASRRMQAVGGFLGFSVIAITFLMVWKPGE